MERVKGIEPSYEAWEAAVLPLNYTRSGGDSSLREAMAVPALGHNSRPLPLFFP